MHVNASPRKPAQTDDEDLASQVMPHVRAAMDMLNLGIVFVSADGRILFANRAARRLLRRRRGVVDHHGQLRAETPRATQTLYRQLRAALSAPEHHRGVVVALPTANRRPLTALIVACRSDLIAGCEAPPAVVFIGDPAARPDMNEAYIARVHDLTPAETRLLRSLLEGKRLVDHARESGITLFTAKGYLKQIFGKTGATRQADLVRLVLADPILRLVAILHGGAD
jgi:DNA-binding CsgD family transcriptional regulator